MFKLILIGLLTLSLSIPGFAVTATKANLSLLSEIQFTAVNKDGFNFKILLPNSDTKYSIKSTPTSLQISFSDTRLSKRWQQKVNLLNLSSIASSLVGTQTAKLAALQLNLTGDYAYKQKHEANWLILSVHKKTTNVIAGKFVGKPISLNFQDISVRAVLQIIAEFAQLNIVTSDAVQGNITLRLKHVPWDQALDIILKTKGLGERQVGNVIFVAPASEIAEQEKLAVTAKAQSVALAPLKSVFLKVSYGDAKSLAALLQDKGHSFLSARGTVAVDQRTNTLLIKDTASHIKEVKSLLQELDVAVRQVSIEARIVVVDKKAYEELGVSMLNGTTSNLSVGSLAGSNASAGISAGISNAVKNPAGTLGLSLGKLPSGFLLDLELQALETEGDGKVISSPHLTVSNKQEAYIEQGSEVPYLAATSSGANQIQFKKAVLGLWVTPQITPDNKVLLDLKVSKDSVSIDVAKADNTPIISTTRVKTRVLVNNNQTVVLGGIYIHDKRKDIRQVPFLGSLPGVGWLFKNSQERDERTELLIFVTPKIIPF